MAQRWMTRCALRPGVAALVVALCPATARAQAPCPTSTGPDVVVHELTGPANFPSDGPFDALSLGTTSCNVGTQRLRWFANDSRHPVIGQNVFRLKRFGPVWRFEQVGRSWLKHGFLSLNENMCCGNCQVTTGDHLGIGCSDPYSAQRNGLQNLLGPRYEVNAHTGQFPHPHANPPWIGSTMRRLEVRTQDLEATHTTSTRYFGEAQYVSADDAAAGNGNNSASYRELSAFKLGTEWTFGFIGSTQRREPAIRAWRRADPEVREVELQLPGEGLLILAQRVTELGAGWWNYEYALHNLNSDDSIRSFSVPVPDGVRVANAGFHDLDYRGGDGQSNVNVDGTDWPSARQTGALVWQTQSFAAEANANALRWASLMNFRFDADTPPADGWITLGAYKSGSAHAIGAQVPAGLPGASFCAGDGSASPCPLGPGCGPGAAGTGCLNSSGTGAWLRATGDPASGALTLWANGMPAITTAVVLRSALQEGGGLGTPFGDGLLCVANAKLRVAAGFTASGAAGFALQHADGPGTFYYQVLYRNQRAFCAPERFNLSNGYAVPFP